jgi:hypothetical protein
MPEKIAHWLRTQSFTVREVTLEGTVNKRGALVDLGDSIPNMIQLYLFSLPGSCKCEYTHRTT